MHLPAPGKPLTRGDLRDRGLERRALDVAFRLLPVRGATGPGPNTPAGNTETENGAGRRNSSPYKPGPLRSRLIRPGNAFSSPRVTSSVGHWRQLPSSPAAIATCGSSRRYQVQLRGGHEPRLGNYAGCERGAPSRSPDGSSAPSPFSLSHADVRILCEPAAELGEHGSARSESSRADRRPGRSVDSFDLEVGRPVPPAATDKDIDCVVCISLIAPARPGRCRS